MSVLLRRTPPQRRRSFFFSTGVSSRPHVICCGGRRSVSRPRPTSLQSGTHVVSATASLPVARSDGDDGARRLGGVSVQQVRVGGAVHLHRGRRFAAQHRRHFAQPQVVVTRELLRHERRVLARQLVGGRRRRRRDGRAACLVAGRRSGRRRLRGVRRVRGHHSRRRRRHRPRLVIHSFAHRVDRVVPEL